MSTELIYPKCLICGGDWYDAPLIREKYITTGCSKGHSSLWYYQNEDICSFDKELRDYGRNIDLEIRWNCHCGEPDCYGKDVVYENINEYDYGSDYEIIKFFDTPPPYSIELDELLKLISYNFIKTFR